MTMTALYKAFDADGVLLYVGITADLMRRWKNHKRDAEWWSEARRFEAVLYDTRQEALAEEARIITEDRPPYNACALAKGLAAKDREREDADAAEAERQAEFWRKWHADNATLEAQEAIDRLNKAAPKAAKITSPETWRRWVRAGCPGVDD